jgi:hypothetical protein
VNQSLQARLVDLSAKQADESVQGVAFDITFESPHGLYQDVSGNDLPGMAHQELKQAKLGFGKNGPLAVAKNFACARVQS